jgi:hypothetical protein
MDAYCTHLHEEPVYVFSQYSDYAGGNRLFSYHTVQNCSATNPALYQVDKFLLLGSFYTLDEFYNWSSISELCAAYL